MNSYSLAGDISCISCPGGKYSPAESAICFPASRIAGIMKVDLDYNTYHPDDWIRSIASLLDTEPSDIHLETYRPGSVVNYFDIIDPSNETIISGSSYNGISQLSGNEKMLLLFQWWLLDDERVAELPYHIIDFRIYAYDSGNDEAITLFADKTVSANPSFPYNPYYVYPEYSPSSHTSITTLPNETSTIQFILGDSSSMLTPSLVTVFLILFVFILL